MGAGLHLGPAWVAWRQSAGCYGWAPLEPPPVRNGVRINIGFSFSFGDASTVPDRWCFVPAAYVASPRIATYYVLPVQTTVVYNNTTVIHNTYVDNNVNVNNTNNTTVVNNGGPAHSDDDRRAGAARGQPAYPAVPARAEVEKATGGGFLLFPGAGPTFAGRQPTSGRVCLKCVGMEIYGS